MPCHNSYQLQNNYAVNSQGQFYESALSPLVRGDKPAYPGGPCAQLSVPLNPWAKGVVNAEKRLNIDGRAVRSNLCLYACDNTGNSMINPVPYQPSTYYTLPGGVPSAIKFFKPCGLRPGL
jgi:hypothetical protein